MKKRIYTNTTGKRKVVGGVAFAPGTSGLVDERDHPDFKPEPVRRPKTERSDPALALLDNKIDDIVEQLPGLSDEDFQRLIQGEKDGKTRAGLLKAFDAEWLRRAEQKAEGSGE